jgi:AraC family transcriptional regulator, positive regulator of tynA and feaB
VANGVRLSRRYINKLFEAEQTSLGRYIWRRRLERCAAKLRDPAFAHVDISVIALEHGFNDLSHFSRAFRIQFGAAPRAYRQLKTSDYIAQLGAGVAAFRLDPQRF